MGELAFSNELTAYKEKVAKLDEQMELEQAEQARMLREKLEKRKTKRALEIESATKERELRIVEAMKEKSQ